MFKLLPYLFSAILAVSFLTPSATCAEKLIIGGGSEGGIYLPLARKLCEVINSDVLQNTFIPSKTAGSVENILKLQSGLFMLGIAQSDIQYLAVNGYTEWTGKPAHELRYVCSLHPEMVTLVASKASGIKSITDLRGKRVSLGPDDSGQNANARQILKASGLDCSKCIKAFSYSPEESLKKMQDGEIDAFFFTSGHPSKVISQALSAKTGAHLVAIDGEKITLLLENVEYFSPAMIDVKTCYPDVTGDAKTVPTIGVNALLLTTSKAPKKLVYDLTKAIFENLADIQQSVPALKGLTKSEMVKNGRIAAYHPGALKYYKESGLLKTE